MPPASKSTIRADIRRAFDRAVTADLESWSRDLCDRLCAFEPVRDARAILAFAPASREPDIRPALHALLARGATLCLPRIAWDAGTMSAARVENLDSLRVRRHAIAEPPDDAQPFPVERLELILVPGVAFDTRCNRLGRGGGFYDRLLATAQCRTLAVGVAFELQVVHSVPMDLHDRALDAVVTQSRLLLRR